MGSIRLSFAIFFIACQFSNPSLGHNEVEPTTSGGSNSNGGGGSKDGIENGPVTDRSTNSNGGYGDATNMPESEFDDALHLEVGDYSTVSYSYFNDQFLNWNKPGISDRKEWNKPDRLKNSYTCYDEYIWCILSQTIQHPVCAMHIANDSERTYKHLPSACDMYWYNCRRGYRFFYVMKYGVCAFQKGNRGSVHLYVQGRK